MKGNFIVKIFTEHFWFVFILASGTKQLGAKAWRKLSLNLTFTVEAEKDATIEIALTTAKFAHI
jgi:hypothetical protein